MDDLFSDPLRFLTECHGRIRLRLSTLGSVARDLRTPRGAERSALMGALQFLRTSGATHTRDEEESLFPRLLDRLDEGSEVEKLITEHRQHEALEGELAAGLHALDPGLSDVDALPDPSAPRVPGATPAALRVADVLLAIVRAYEDHIPVEDERIFPMARQTLPAGDIEAIAAEMRARHRVDRKLLG